MDPVLLQAAKALGESLSVDKITALLDELEFLYDALDDEQQQLADDLMARLRAHPPTSDSER